MPFDDIPGQIHLFSEDVSGPREEGKDSGQSMSWSELRIRSVARRVSSEWLARLRMSQP